MLAIPRARDDSTTACASSSVCGRILSLFGEPLLLSRGGADGMATATAIASGGGDVVVSSASVFSTAQPS